ncbi:MAG: epoxyqueuosine reductase QueH [Deltaproteobacteria bacterium]|nr:epoxyqueuosine reductase QueH [Deltaproteobacteria bacterium]
MIEVVNKIDLSSGPEKIPARVLVHICCGPCSIMPLKAILGSAEVWGFFHNPNIHPYSEFKLRLDAVKKLAGFLSINVLYDEEYKPIPFIKGLKATSDGVKHPPKDVRCEFCYSTRLEETARAAKKNGFDAFSSSLLYSKYQNHEQIKGLGVDLAKKYGILFFYKDFRDFWQQGIDNSKEMGLYRQKYCGCVYSKIERYPKKYMKIPPVLK